MAKVLYQQNPWQYQKCCNSETKVDICSSEVLQATGTNYKYQTISWRKVQFWASMARRLQRSMISMITIAIYISLFSVCRGAAVDAPITQSQTEKSELLTPTTSNSISTTESSHNHQHLDDSSGSVSETSEVKVGSHPRFARSVPAPESVVNYNYLPSLSDYESDMRDMSYIRQSHKLPVNSLSSSDYMTRDKPTWQLEPQVGKASTRGKRVRGGQSYYNSRREQLPQELVDTLDAVERGAATTMLSRQQRNGRRYDVPQIGRRLTSTHIWVL